MTSPADETAFATSTLGEPSGARAARGRFASRYAWAVLVYMVAVVLFGAWVRITGSGAGCGRHWPTCHGEVIPARPEVETVIELTHRATSGLLGLLVIGLVALTFAGHASRRARVAALVTLVFTVLEALIGAGLVLGELVASNDSVARAVVIAIHLVSTFTLTAATALTAWYSRETDLAAPGRATSAASSRNRWLFGAALVIVVVVSVAGAVTALGDTLFPVSPTEGEGLLAHLRADLSPAAHFLVRLRIVHPVIAVLGAGFLLAFPAYLHDSSVGHRAARLLTGLRAVVIVQTAAGVANIWLGAPGAMQIVHLLLAQILWLLLVLSVAATREPATPRRELVTQPA